MNNLDYSQKTYDELIELLIKGNGISNEEEKNIVLEISKRERVEIVENNDNLKQIVQYNKLLTDLNEKMLLKMSLVNDTLEDVLNSIGSNSQKIETLSSEQILKLDELKRILESNAPDKNNKVTSYFAGLSGNLAVTMFAEYLKMKYFSTGM